MLGKTTDRPAGTGEPSPPEPVATKAEGVHTCDVHVLGRRWVD